MDDESNADDGEGEAKADGEAEGDAEPDPAEPADIGENEPQPAGVTIVVDRKTNSLIVEGRTQDLDELESLVARLTAGVETGEDEFRIFRLKHADPQATAAILEGLFNPEPIQVGNDRDRRDRDRRDDRRRGDRPPPRDTDTAYVQPQISVVADSRTRTLLVRADPTDLAVIDKLIEQLDQVTEVVSEVRVFPLKNAAANEVASNLQELFALSAGQGGAQPSGRSRRGQQARAQMVRQLVQLKLGERLSKLDTASVLNVSANQQTNAVVVAAPSDVMPIVERLVQELDQSAAAATQPVLRLYPVQNASAEQLVAALKQAFPDRRRGQAPVSFAADSSGQLVLVSAPAQDHELIQRVIQQMDEAREEAGLTVRVYRLRHSQPRSMAAALNQSLGEQPGGRGRGQASDPAEPRISPDPGSGSLVVRASDADHERIAALIEQMDRPAAQDLPVRVIALNHADPAQVAPTLMRVFGDPGQRRGRGSSGETVSVEADPRSRMLLVRAEDDLFERIRDLARQLDTASGQSELDPTILSLTHAEAGSVATAVTQAFAPPRGTRPDPDDRVSVVAEPTSNSVIVTASSENLERAKALVARLDTEVAGGRRSELIVLNHARAAELAPVLSRIAASLSTTAAAGGRRGRRGGRGGGGGPDSVSVEADPGSNALLLAGPAGQLDRVMQMARQLDEQTEAGGTGVYIIPLERGDATRVAGMVRDLYQQQARAAAQQRRPFEPLAVTADPRANAVIVAASEAMHEHVKAWIQQVEDIKPAGGEARIITIEQADPEEVEQAIDELFAPEGEPQSRRGGRRGGRAAAGGGVVGGGGRVTTTLLAKQRALLVEADDADFQAIQDLVNALDAEAAKTQQKARVFRLEHTPNTRMAEALQRVFAPREQDRPEDRVSVTALPQSDAVVVTTSEPRMQRVAEVIEQLDTAEVAGQPEFRVFTLDNATPSKVLPLLRQMLNQVQDQLDEPIGVQADDRTKTLIVTARQGVFEQVGKLIETLDREPAHAEVAVSLVPLVHADASRLAAVLTRLLQPTAEGQATPEAQALLEQVRKLRVVGEDEAALVDAADGEAGADGEAEAAGEAAEGVGGLPALDLTQPIQILADPLNTGQQGGNQLLVTSTADNLRTLRALIDLMDRVPMARDARLRIVRLEHADASLVAQTLREVFEPARQRLAGQPGTPVAGRAEPSSVAGQGLVNPLNVASDIRSNAVILTGQPASVDLAQTLARDLDREQPIETRDIRFIKLQNAKAETIAPILQDMMDQRVERQEALGAQDAARLRVIIRADPRGNGLIVGGPQDAYELVKALADQLDAEGAVAASDFRVFPLEHATAGKLQPTLQELFDARMQRDEEAEPITVIAEPTANALVVGAAREDMPLVEQTIRRLDQPAEDAAGQNARLFPLKKADATQVARTLRELFESPDGPDAGGLTVSVDERMNAVVVSGGAADLKRAERLIQQLDTDTLTQITELRVFPLQNADAVELAELLMTSLTDEPQGGPEATGSRQTMLQFITRSWDGEQLLTRAIQDGLLITPDRRTNSLVVKANRDSMPLLESMIASMDSFSPRMAEVRMFTLKHADAEQMAELLRELFRLESPGEGPDRAVSYRLAGGAGRGGGGSGGQGGAAAGAAGSADAANVRPADNPAGNAAPSSAATAGESGGPVANLGTAEQHALNVTVDARTNSLLIGGTRDYVSLASQIIGELDASPAQSRRTSVYRLRNAQAEEIQSALAEFLTQERQRLEQVLGPDRMGAARRRLEHEVSVVAEPESNTLLLSASPRYYDTIFGIIEELDQPPPQVLIQVLLAEVTLNESNELGLEWNYVGDLQGDATLGVNTDFGVQADQTQDGGFAVSVTGGDFELLLRALAADGRMEVLSRPQILATDNQEAQINIGQSVPFITNSRINDNGDIINTIQYEDIGVILEVLPRINDDGLVTLEIRPEVSSIAESTITIAEGVNATVFNERSAVTTVSVQDGQTIVMGGLITTEDFRSERKIPIVGDIPIVGALFRSTKIEKSRTELLIVLTPHVIRGRDKADTMTEDQVEQIELLREIDRDRVKGRIFMPLSDESAITNQELLNLGRKQPVQPEAKREAEEAADPVDATPSPEPPATQP